MDRAISELDLHAYVDGQLDTERIEEVQRHLASHPEDAARVQDLLRQKELLRRLAEALPAPAPSRSSAFLERRLARALGGPRRRRLARAGAALAAGIVIGLLAQIGAEDLFDSDDVPRFADEAVEAHVVFAADPEALIANDIDQMPSLLASMGQPLGLAQLPGSELKLIGAHLTATDDGAAVVLVYEDQLQQRLSLVISGEPTSRNTPPQLAHRGGLALVYWRHGNTSFALTGNVYDQEVLRLAQFIRANQRT